MTLRIFICILDVRRKLGFLGKVGYDIFGKNTFFAPNVKWETLETTVNEVKDAAESYEKAFNDVISSVENQENFKQVSDVEAITVADPGCLKGRWLT